VNVTVTRIYTFEAAHRLPDEFGGPATRLHGHTYTVRVTTPGGVRTEDTDATWETLRADLDHSLLNDVVDDTTVEGLAAFLLHELDAEAVEVQEGNLRYARAER
jgi:6-pyruvoyl-tetrahydropterin synthase